MLYHQTNKTFELLHVQLIYVSSFKGANEEKFNADLKVMSALMAYEDPENSPVGSLLAQEHRDRLADEVNSAILCRFCDLCLLL
jgi:hypothetical protein